MTNPHQELEEPVEDDTQRFDNLIPSLVRPSITPSSLSLLPSQSLLPRPPPPPRPTSSISTSPAHPDTTVSKHCQPTGTAAVAHTLNADGVGILSVDDDLVGPQDVSLMQQVVWGLYFLTCLAILICLVLIPLVK